MIPGIFNLKTLYKLLLLVFLAPINDPYKQKAFQNLKGFSLIYCSLLILKQVLLYLWSFYRELRLLFLF
jgi:hypothetical protein